MRTLRSYNGVPSSENSEETELEQAPPNITPGRTVKQMNWSLTESQLENLFDTSISVDDVTSPSCYEIASTANQAEEMKYTHCELSREMSHQVLIHYLSMALLSGLTKPRIRTQDVTKNRPTSFLICSIHHNCSFNTIITSSIPFKLQKHLLFLLWLDIVSHEKMHGLFTGD